MNGQCDAARKGRAAKRLESISREILQLFKAKSDAKNGGFGLIHYGPNEKSFSWRTETGTLVDAKGTFVLLNE